ncbi:MAG: HAD family hydrolase, partial [Phycisphaerae bacterium]|nr:HAD family hydrolase [Phycisphaerae bacterium]
LDRKARGLRITLNDGQLEELAGLWYKPLSDVAVIEDNLHETLGTLRDMGLRLAVLSNTFLPPGVLDGHLEKHKILDYFSTTIYSSETLVRKPNPQIYQFALDAMEIDGPEAIMVGDRLREDVRGPEQLGIKGIFKRGIVNRNKRIPSDVIAINRIDELPDVITGMSQTS